MVSRYEPIPEKFLLFLVRFSAAFLLLCSSNLLAAEAKVLSQFKKEIEPILAEYCYDCHGDGTKKGGVALDEFNSEESFFAKRDLWLAALKNVRAGIMPPEKKARPSEKERQRLEQWIKHGVFNIDPENPDPGRVTIRRLNRVEYRNTIRDLMGVDFKADEEFPPDDTGYGFDNIGDVLTVSPLLLEKYMHAAETIVAMAVPTVSRVIPEQRLTGRDFRGGEGGVHGERMNFYKAGEVAAKFRIEQPGEYRWTLELEVLGQFDFDPGQCRVQFEVDGQEQLRHEFAWQNNKRFPFQFTNQWSPGEHSMRLKLEPLKAETEKRNSLDLRIVSVKIEGPLDSKLWTRTPNYDRFFSRETPPASSKERREYAQEVLERFARKAFRRPVDRPTVDRLVQLAEQVWRQPGKKFEDGAAQAMVAVLASPRFLFRVEEVESSAANPRVAETRPARGKSAQTKSARDRAPRPKNNSETPSATLAAPVDEFSLASRLSYFLWSTMPDDTLMGLAERGELRKNLAAQVQRMLADERADEWIENFVGQWLQVRDVEGIQINARVVLRRDGADMARQSERPRRPFERPAVELDGPLRRAMREETELMFRYIVREDRSVLELIDSDYTFLNERLARHYGIPDVIGGEMRRVSLPSGHARGGILTQGSVLTVTSNPTRTSPVKRGLFILDNLLGTPAPPPPPDVPELEEAERAFKDREPTMREAMEMHRSKALCSSCHSRMDPLGLALENFNALGMWREKERGQPIDTTGRLITGESFSGLSDLKRILTNERRLDFYRCLTEKLLTYALGRGLEYYDVHAVDQIVERLNSADGKMSALLMGVIESAPFQKRRQLPAVTSVEPGESVKSIAQN
ncbi:MAG: DUF1592 domain-containing protein [Verrucomicrobiota bacterium]